MARDKGEKKKDRERVVREKMIRRRMAMMQARKEERAKAKLAHETRRRQEPIVRHRLGGDTSVPMSQERPIEIQADNLRANLEKLRQMEVEYVEQDLAREKMKERLDDAGDPTEPVGDQPGADLG